MTLHKHKVSTITRSRFSTELIVNEILSKKIDAKEAIDTIDEKILYNQEAFIRELLIKLYNDDRDAFIEDYEKYVTKVTLLNSVSSLTADERKHILAVINSLVNGDLVQIWW